MRFSFRSFCAVQCIVTTGLSLPGIAPMDKDKYPLVGYGKDNPIGPTTGGAGGTSVTVSTPEDLQAAVEGDSPQIVYLDGTFNLTGSLQVGSNKSLLGLGRGAEIINNGISVDSKTNVIIRNLRIGYIVGGDAIGVTNSTRLWIDHNELASDISRGPDFYDGQIDIVRASDWITVSWNYLHDHWKSSLVGNDDGLRDVDFGHLHITYHHNFWKNEGTRGPAGRFGHQHVFNNYYEDLMYQAIHSRSDNQVLVEANVFRGDTREALSSYGFVIPEDSPNTSPDGDEELDGFANLGATNDWGPASINITRQGTFTEAPYEYTLTPLEDVMAEVKAGAGLNMVDVKSQ